MDYFNAFWFGGLICALIQILLDKTKLMPGRAVTLQSNCSSAAKGMQYHCKIVALILQWLRTDYKIIAFRTELHHGRRQTKRKRMP